MASPKNTDATATAPTPPPLVGSSTETQASATAPTAPVVAEAGFDFNAFDDAAAKAHLEAASMLEMINEDIRTGEYSGVPHELVAANYHFVRVGLRGSPNTERKARYLRERGYVDAPKGVRAVGSGYVKDGDHALIMCARPEAHRRLQAEKLMKAKARGGRLQKSRLREIEDQLRSSLPRGTDLHVSAALREGSRDSFDDDMRAVERDIPRAR